MLSIMKRKVLETGAAQSCNVRHRKPGRLYMSMAQLHGCTSFTEGSPTKLSTPCKTVPADNSETFKDKSPWGKFNI